MTPVAIKALKLSIAHWQRLASGKRKSSEQPDKYNCDLCREFFEIGCKGCPVKLKTKRSNCHETPYRKASRLFYLQGPHSPQFRAAARKELAFLKSLLPKKGKP